MNIPDNLLYTKEHEWVKREDNLAKVGVTDYAQSSLGDITFVELPKAGASLEQFKEFATVESVKAASDVYAPVSGKVIRINEEFNNSPELINQSPYEKGWFAIIELKDEKELEGLLSPKRYEEHLKGLSK